MKRYNNRSASKYYALLIIVILAFVSGCAPSVSHPDLQLKKSPTWLSDGKKYHTPDSAWWQTFSDEKLNELIALALKNNHNYKAALARMEAAQAQKTIAGAGLFPSLSVGTNGTRRKQNFIGLPIPNPGGGVPSSISNTYGVSANISWEIDLWGKARNARSAAAAQFQASQADFNAVRLSLIAQTIKAWYAVSDASQQLQLAQETLSSYEKSQDRIYQRFNRGLRSSLDYRLARTSAANAQSQYYLRAMQSEQSKRQVEIMIGRYPAAKVEGAEGLPQLLSDIPAGIPADILLRRPDLVALERRLAAADCNVSVARAALFPSINLTGSAGTSTNDLNEILNMDFSVWSIAGNLLQPIFQGGRLLANVDLNKAMQKQAYEAYAQGALNAYSEIEMVLSKEQYLKKQERATQTATNEAIAAMELAESRYNKGLIDIVTLLDSQRKANDAKSALLNIRRQRIDNRVDFYVAIGGHYNPEKN